MYTMHILAMLSLAHLPLYSLTQYIPYSQQGTETPTSTWPGPSCRPGSRLCRSLYGTVLDEKDRNKFQANISAFTVLSRVHNPLGGLWTLDSTVNQQILADLEMKLLALISLWPIGVFKQKSIAGCCSHTYAAMAQSCIYDKRWPAIYFGRFAPNGEISEIKSPAKIS